MEIEVKKLDNLGRGIGYVNDKIIFIPKSIPNDIVDVTIVKEKKNYLEGKINKIIKPAKIRRDAICPYFNECGGCDLMHVSLTEELSYKLMKINEILKKNNLNYEVKRIIKSNNEYYYRNKITLKVINKKIGYYKSNSHELLEIKHCYIVKEEINVLLKDLEKLNIINGDIVIRCNKKKELLIIIDSQDKVQNISYFTDNYNIVGIIKNDECLYGEDYLMENVLNYLFKVSYNAFFQVNNAICQELFTLIKKETINSLNGLDLYCGVGTLAIVSSENAKKVLGVEILQRAIDDANFNKKLNRQENVTFICSDTKNILNEITSLYDIVILDPPRRGVNEEVLRKIKIAKIKKIIYISCNPFTLVRDLKILLNDYEIEDFILLDMFVWSEHIESFVVLKHL